MRFLIDLQITKCKYSQINNPIISITHNSKMTNLQLNNPIISLQEAWYSDAALELLEFNGKKKNMILQMGFDSVRWEWGKFSSLVWKKKKEDYSLVQFNKSKEIEYMKKTKRIFHFNEKKGVSLLSKNQNWLLFKIWCQAETCISSKADVLLVFKVYF